MVVAALVVLGYVVYGQVASAGDGKSGMRWQTGMPKYTYQSNDVGGWKFDAMRDRDNHTLTHAQCDATFPLLYHEIDRAKEHWRKFQGDKHISPEQIDLKWSGDGGLGAMIYDQQVRSAIP